MNNIISLSAYRGKDDRQPKKDRLGKALASLLSSNMKTQKKVEKYSATLKELDEAVKGLEKSYVMYQQNINKVKLKPLRRKSRNLADMMDRWSA